LLAKYLKNNNIEVSTLLGGRSSGDIVEVEDFERFGKVFITTEDGSTGFKGLVTQHPEFEDIGFKLREIYSCGPEPMLRAVAIEAFRQNIECEVSLENTMACGIGACLCCIVETKHGNQCVCTAGPVFNINELTGWDAFKVSGENCPV